MKKIIKELWDKRELYMLAIPGFLFLIVFRYIPLQGHILAFKNYRLRDGIWGSRWVGFENFEFFFTSRDFLIVTRNTIFLNILFIFGSLLMGLVLAIFLNEIRNYFYKRFSQSVIFLPHFISWMVVSIMVYGFFSTSGLINNFITSIGLEKVKWYMNPEPWPIILMFIRIWKAAGYNSIIFLAAITGLPSSIYESAMIDGANRFQQILYITIPLVRSTAIILALLAIGRIFSGDFGMIYAIIGDNGILYEYTDIIDTYAYRALRQMGDFSMSSVIVLYQSTMGVITIMLFNWVVKKVDKESSLF
ncbi:MAG: ABC transporter permease [Halothermotrichaceae bacterium]